MRVERPFYHTKTCEHAVNDATRSFHFFSFQIVIISCFFIFDAKLPTSSEMAAFLSEAVVIAEKQMRHKKNNINITQNEIPPICNNRKLKCQTEDDCFGYII